MKQIPQLTITQIERFTAKFDVDTNGCWLWNAALSADDYGVFAIGKGNAFRAHRVGYSLIHGNTKLELDHLCRNTACVNPKHLEPVTTIENVRRQYLTNSTKTSTHCRNGHEYNETNSYVANYPSKSTKVCRICYKQRRVSAKVGLTASLAA